MNKFFAICPFCSKSILVEENLSGGYACSYCGQAFGLDFMRKNDLIVDSKTATEEYELAQEYFINTDFREAGAHFNKVLQCDRNNYLSEYYSRLCNIYENELGDEYNIPLAISDAILFSISKLHLSLASIGNKIEFLQSVFHEAFIILSNHYSKILDKYEIKEDWSCLRAESLNVITKLKPLFLTDRESMMTYDPVIAKELVNICDLCICACHKIVAPHIINNNILSVASDAEYNLTKEHFSVFYFYATDLNRNYDFTNHKPDYSGNLLYNESVMDNLNRYNDENRGNRKKFLSTKGDILKNLMSDFNTAIKYTYHTCFKDLGKTNKNQSRYTLINESVAFCFETLMPRIFYEKEKKVSIEIKSYAKMTEVTEYLNKFLLEMSVLNKYAATDMLNDFYSELHEMVKIYFSTVYNNYTKFVNKLKAVKNAEYSYYTGFLYNIVCCSALALKEVIKLDKYKCGDRLKLLKLGKQAAEEFLLMYDYSIEEIERNANFADILDIYNLLDDNIEFFSSKSVS